MDVTIQMMVLTIWMKPLQRYFHILSAYLVQYVILTFETVWQNPVAMPNLSISSSLTRLSALKWVSGSEWENKSVASEKKFFWGYLKNNSIIVYKTLMNVNSVLTSDAVIFQPAFLT